jgi:hypothetical protein
MFGRTRVKTSLTRLEKELRLLLFFFARKTGLLTTGINWGRFVWAWALYHAPPRTQPEGRRLEAWNTKNQEAWVRMLFIFSQEKQGI